MGDKDGQIALTDKILELLTGNPSGDEVAQALALDFLRPFTTNKLRISLLGSDDSLHFLGDYGWNPSKTHTSESSEVWRNRQDDIIDIDIVNDFFGTNPDRTAATALLKIRGVTTGTVTMNFHDPLTESQLTELEGMLRDITKPISLFFMVRPTFGHGAPSTYGSSAVIDVGSFSDRQLKILKAITEGRTNHVIASNLGFSVSTIRHETMRIFEKLNVSDRQSAAHKAQSLGIL